MTDKTPHPRAELIAEWIKDTSQEIWFWNGSDWISTYDKALITIRNAGHYAIGHKPTQPPARVCTLAGVEFPEPMRSAPPVGTKVWLATLNGGPIEGEWEGESYEIEAFETGRVQATREGAIAQGRAMLAALKQAVEGAR
jgi:hypothetical protein